MIEIKRILCPVDLSDHSRHALHHAAAIAQWYESTITLLYVHPFVPDAAAAAYGMALAQEADARLTVLKVVELPADAHERLPHLSPGVREYVAAVEEDHRQRLGSAVPEAVRAYCDVETMMVPGKPYREILRVAAEQRSDLIVIGVHGRGPADRLFFGSTTQHVVRQATCPVLTLRR